MQDISCFGGLMTVPRRYFKRGTLPNQIEFDPGRAFSTAGGNGELYRGTLHLSAHPDGSTFQYCNVALKRMRWGTDDEDTRLDDIIDETYVWKRVIHPNILRFLGLLAEDDDMYLVAPFAPHGSLPQYIAAHPDANRPILLWQVSVGIAHLHEQNIIHGDLKGANVLVFDGPTAKICDFGLSKYFDGKQSTKPRYSLPWASPERLRDEPRSYSSDVYAFGMTVYEILSNRIPFSTLNFIALFHAVCTNEERPQKHPNSSSSGISYALLWSLAERCWHSVQDKRPSMNEVRDCIRSYGATSVVVDNSGDLILLNLPPRSSDAGHKRRRVNDVPGPNGTTMPDEVCGILTDGVAYTTEAEQDVESQRTKRPKLQEGRAVDRNSKGKGIVPPLADQSTDPQDAVMNTSTIQLADLQRQRTHQMEDEVDQLNIVGAVVVQHHQLKNLRPVQCLNRNDATGFWADLVEAEVASKRSLVKMYYKRTGGERAFLRDIKRFGDCPFGLPQVRAYCFKSSTPFIVLEAEITIPLKNHLLNLATNVVADDADRKIWNTIVNLNAKRPPPPPRIFRRLTSTLDELQTAANFINLHCQDIRMSSLAAALENARVDQDGRLALAPAWKDFPGPHVGERSGATELTRRMLKRLLMGDHAFHRLSCISFTFWAASWSYMTRDDVLKLSDAARAEAHYCAHAGSGLSSDSAEQSANESYEAWTNCSCLSNHVVRPRPTRSTFYLVSNPVNQALHLGLSPPVKTAVEDIVNVRDFEPKVQHNTGTAQHSIRPHYKKLGTLPPRFWALLLIADAPPEEGSGNHDDPQSEGRVEPIRSTVPDGQGRSPPSEYTRRIESARPKVTTSQQKQGSFHDPRSKREWLNKQLPLQSGRKVAFRPPQQGMGNGRGCMDLGIEGDSAIWILAVVKRSFGQDKQKYEVQDGDRKDGEQGQKYNTTVKSLIPLPDASTPLDSPQNPLAYGEFPAGTSVLGLYPDTSCFYKAIVIAGPRNFSPTGSTALKHPTYQLKFEDDNDYVRSVGIEWVVEAPDYD